MIVWSISNVEWLLKNQELKKQSTVIIGVMLLSVLDENQERVICEIFNQFTPDLAAIWSISYHMDHMSYGPYQMAGIKLPQ